MYEVMLLVFGKSPFVPTHVRLWLAGIFCGRHVAVKKFAPGQDEEQVRKEIEHTWWASHKLDKFVVKFEGWFIGEESESEVQTGVTPAYYMVTEFAKRNVRSLTTKKRKQPGTGMNDSIWVRHML